MIKIVKGQLLDVIELEVGFIYAQRAKITGGQDTVAFFAYDKDNNKTLPVKVKMYLGAKFGSQYRPIAKELGNYISCDCEVLQSNGVITMSDDGSMKLFDTEGEIVMKEKLIYQNCYVKSLAVDGTCFWCVCPERNSIVKFSPIEKRVMFRIGGGANIAFRGPHFVYKNDKYLYIGCNNQKLIRRLNLENYSVVDYVKSDEKIKKYFKINNNEYLWTESGVFLLDESDICRF